MKVTLGMKTKRKMSLSAVDMAALDNFIASLAILSAAKRKSMMKQKAAFVGYANAGKKFMSRFGMLKPFMDLSRTFLKTMTLPDGLGEQFAELLKEHLPAMVEETDIPQPKLALIKDSRLIMSKDSDAAYKRVTSNISAIKMPAVASLFTDVKDVPTVKDQADTMRRIVKALTKRSGDPILTLNEIREFRTSNPDQIAKYSEARKVFAEAYKKGLAAFVRASGKTVVDVKAARSYLAKIDADYIPKGFVGGIDDKGQLYTTEGKLIKGMLIGEVVMNPKYDPKSDNTYVCSLKNSPTQRLRTGSFLSGNKEKRFQVVRDLASNIEKMRKSTWVKDLASKDDTTRKIATIIETVYQTQARIGGVGNEAKGESTFGIATLEKRHMKVTASAITMDYPGKKGTPQHHVLKGSDVTQKKLLANLTEFYRAAPSPNSPVFAMGRGSVPPARVNRYLKEHGINATIHKFRHIKGNAIAIQQIEACPYQKKGDVSQAQAEKWYKEAMKAVGEALHHQNGGNVTGLTAITSYIDPKISQDFFKNLGLRIPKWVPTKDED